MLRAAIVYGLALAAFALFLEWAQASHALHFIDTDIYVGLLAILFTALGLWIGLRLTAKRHDGLFSPNKSALLALGISSRENEVLLLLAAGHSNKEIARLLGISPNTVKTHVASIFAKLDANRRTQAIRNAQAIGIIP